MLTSHGHKMNREVGKQKKTEKKRERVSVRTSEYSWDEARMRRRKLRRVLKSSGYDAASRYAETHGLLEDLKRMAEVNDPMASRIKEELPAT